MRIMNKIVSFGSRPKPTKSPPRRSRKSGILCLKNRGRSGKDEVDKLISLWLARGEGSEKRVCTRLSSSFKALRLREISDRLSHSTQRYSQEAQASSSISLFVLILFVDILLTFAWYTLGNYLFGAFIVAFDFDAECAVVIYGMRRINSIVVGIGILMGITYTNDILPPAQQYHSNTPETRPYIYLGALGVVYFYISYLLCSIACLYENSQTIRGD